MPPSGAAEGRSLAQNEGAGGLISGEDRPACSWKSLKRLAIDVRGSGVLVTRQRFYLPQLDGLRFLAFLAAFYLHFMEHTRRPGGRRMDAGALGVDLFFVLSSFLITSPLTAGEGSTGHGSRARVLGPENPAYLAPLFRLCSGGGTF